MSHEERSTITNLICNLAGTIYVIVRLRAHWISGAFDAPDALALWGRTILWAIGLVIVLNIVLSILSGIVFAVATGEDDDRIVDERDQVFEVRGMGIMMLMACAGLVLSIALLAWGVAALPVFTVIYFSFALGDFASNLVKLLSYRAGC